VRATCTVDGCDGQPTAKGWCSLHYQRWRRNGDPLVVKRGRPPAERFLSKFTQGPADECWPWGGYVGGEGYGRMEIAGKCVLMHRFSYEHFVGPIPDGLALDHICHDPRQCSGGSSCPHRRCVNPSHLRPVTKVENLTGERHYLRVADSCPNGHPYTDESTDVGNLAPTPNGRRCLICRKAKFKRQSEKRKRLRREKRRAAGLDAPVGEWTEMQP